jgi:hypothetical protein
MPVIKRQMPLLPEGEYVGQALKVTQEYSKTSGITMFRIPLHLPDGRTITTIARVTEQTAFVFDQLCKSGNISLPEDGSDFQITPDDIERRVFYFGVQHNKGTDGRTFANVRFHTRGYAIQQNPALASVTFPTAAPPITLRSAPVSSQEPPSADGALPAKSVPPTRSPEAGATKNTPFDDELEGISPEEFAQALEAAKALKRGKAPAAMTAAG